MRVLFLITCVALSSFVHCQSKFPINSETKLAEYTDVVNVDSLSADDIFRKAKFFIADQANSAKDVTKLEDDVSKTIIVKGYLPVYHKVPFTGTTHTGNARLKLTVFAKDGKYKYSITDIVYEGLNGYGQTVTQTPVESEKYNAPMVPKKYWVDLRNEVDKEIREYIESLKKFMNTKQQDW